MSVIESLTVDRRDPNLTAEELRALDDVIGRGIRSGQVRADRYQETEVTSHDAECRIARFRKRDVASVHPRFTIELATLPECERAVLEGFAIRMLEEGIATINGEAAEVEP